MSLLSLVAPGSGVSFFFLLSTSTGASTTRAALNRLGAVPLPQRAARWRAELEGGVGFRIYTGSLCFGFCKGFWGLSACRAQGLHGRFFGTGL